MALTAQEISEFCKIHDRCAECDLFKKRNSQFPECLLTQTAPSKQDLQEIEQLIDRENERRFCVEFLTLWRKGYKL